MEEAVEGRAGPVELTGPQVSKHLRQQRSRLSRKLRTDAPNLLELVHRAVSYAPPHERVDQLEPHRQVPRSNRDDVAQLVLIGTVRRGIAGAERCIELGERVVDVRVAR